ncbi:MAG: hypothetical protein JWQ90_1518 [Hydrocarboniphaga sp.]|uniref:ImmA/IrrE family metallo-endopeptidase n=1 Tax=Hydrocarboniphaga sp. TaxID=2033016 RepID=UPI002632453B|nr:ImmA/IrrE family metallo-endopeptidase [Hydrocarboniphaga sp.]MDB5969068.1 hypothetical protein [Hydrocarboniphaga sp.]
MELADCGSLEKIADEIFRQMSEIPTPVPIEDIALALDIADIRGLEADGFEGGLVTDAERSSGAILVKEGSSLERRRFTVGHELGHFLCTWHQPPANDGFRCSTGDMRKTITGQVDRLADIEVQANRFSVLLLLPAVAISRDLKKKAGVDIEHILYLAGRYQMSKEATARRYVELRGERCAAIVSHLGKVLRIYRQRDFPFIDVRSGEAIPRTAITARLNPPLGRPSDCETVDGSTWLSTTIGTRLPSLYEQVLVQANGYRLTLLSFDEDEVDEAAEDEELRESWAIRFKGKR